MSIVDMSRITAVGLRQDRDAILDALTRAGAVDIADVSGMESSGADAADTGTKADPELAAARDRLNRLETVIETSRQFCPPEKKGFMKSRRQVTRTEYGDVVARQEEILTDADRMETIRMNGSAARGQRTRLQALHDLLVPWADIPLDLSVTETELTEMPMGTLPAGLRFEQFAATFQEAVQPSHIEILADDGSMVRFAAVYMKNDRATARRLLKEHGFSSVPATGETGTPAQQIAALTDRLEKQSRELSEMDEEAQAIAERRQADFEILYDHVMIRVAQLEAMARMHRTRETFILAGWVPARLADGVSRGLSDRFVAAVDIRPPAKGEDYPVMLDNPSVVRPYEAITDMFSTPRTNEMDPNTLLAPFFFILFGLMLSDAGYGLLLAAACAGLVWGVKVRGNMRKMCLLLFQGGLAGILSGILFGSFFGDLLSVASQQRVHFPTLLFSPLNEPVLMMIVSLALGVVHIFTGMAAKVYMLVRGHKPLDALLDVGSWYFLLIGLALLGAGAVMPDIGWASTAGLLLAGSGAVMIVGFSARTTRSPVKRILKGLYTLYGMTGYLSDILSYTRILALGLASGVIAMVVNMIASIAGFGWIGLPLFILVVIGGHLLNLAISALGAYVHTSRLQYVEFFSKFFEGGGRAWTPLSIQTRYTEIRE